MVVGENRKMVTALIAPDFENLRQWCRDKNIPWTDGESVLQKDRVIERYDEVIKEKNQDLGHTEAIKRFRLVPDEWTIQGGELTPTMNIKRDVLTEEYSDLINEMYAQ